jgi:acetyltransferase-like isoleucine patch superfamily enzyme
MTKSLLSRLLNRVLHSIARHGPGATSFRVILHRMRGVKIGSSVFIGDEVYIENEYPERVEIGDEVQISVRAVFIAHTRGAGRIIVEDGAYIGPNVVVACPGDRTLRIGAGSVVSAGSVITRDVPPGVLVGIEPARPIAKVTLTLSKAKTFQEFVRGLTPLRRKLTNQPEQRTVVSGQPDAEYPGDP